MDVNKAQQIIENACSILKDSKKHRSSRKAKKPPKPRGNEVQFDSPDCIDSPSRFAFSPKLNSLQHPNKISSPKGYCKTKCHTEDIQYKMQPNARHENNGGKNAAGSFSSRKAQGDIVPREESRSLTMPSHYHDSNSKGDIASTTATSSRPYTSMPTNPAPLNYELIDEGRFNSKYFQRNESKRQCHSSKTRPTTQGSFHSPNLSVIGKQLRETNGMLRTRDLRFPQQSSVPCISEELNLSPREKFSLLCTDKKSENLLQENRFCMYKKSNFTNDSGLTSCLYSNSSSSDQYDDAQIFRPKTTASNNSSSSNNNNNSSKLYQTETTDTKFCLDGLLVKDFKRTKSQPFDIPKYVRQSVLPSPHSGNITKRLRRKGLHPDNMDQLLGVGMRQPRF